MLKMEEIIKTDPLTGDKFVAKRANQRFATKENRIKFHNNQASILNQKRAFFDKPCKQSQILLQKLDGTKLDNKFHVEFLTGIGVHLDAYNHVKQKDAGDLFCYYDYALQKTDNPEFLKIIKL